MNVKSIFRARMLCGLAIAFGSAVAPPVVAQQNDMQGMPMPQPPASAASVPASASSSTDGMDMQDMGMQSMQGMQMPTPEPKTQATQPAHSMHGTQGMPVQKPQASQPASGSSSATSMQDMEMQGMQMPMKPPQPAEMQHLHFGNMIGTRPKPDGLAGMETMPMPSMQGGRAPPDARSPDYSDGYTYGPMPGMDMSDDGTQGMLMLDQLELEQSMHGGHTAFVEGEAWYGKDFDKLWLKAEGEASDGTLQDLRTEALWAHAVAPYWNTQLGVRHDFGIGPDRNWVAFGIEGLAPYWFETEATLYAGQGGRTAARVQFEYDELLTQRLVLQPMFESNAYGKDDPQRGIGAGLSDASLGLRLRYEISRQFAPYIGVQWMRKFGKTARYARNAGESVSDTQFVAGVRIWF